MKILGSVMTRTCSGVYEVKTPYGEAVLYGPPLREKVLAFFIPLSKEGGVSVEGSDYAETIRRLEEAVSPFVPVFPPFTWRGIQFEAEPGSFRKLTGTHGKLTVSVLAEDHGFYVDIFLSGESLSWHRTSEMPTAIEAVEEVAQSFSKWLVETKTHMETQIRDHFNPSISFMEGVLK